MYDFSLVIINFSKNIKFPQESENNCSIKIFHVFQVFNTSYFYFYLFLNICQFNVFTYLQF